MARSPFGNAVAADRSIQIRGLATRAAEITKTAEAIKQTSNTVNAKRQERLSTCRA